MEDVNKTLGTEPKNVKSKKKQQSSNAHNNNKSGDNASSSSSESDSSGSSSSSSEDSDSDSDAETKTSKDPTTASSIAPSRNNNAGQKHPAHQPSVLPTLPLPPAAHPKATSGDEMNTPIVKVRNDLMPPGSSSTSIPAASSLGPGNLGPLQTIMQRPLPQPVSHGSSTTPHQSPSQILSIPPPNLSGPKIPPGPLPHLSTVINSGGPNMDSSVDSPAGPQKTKAMLKGWTTLGASGGTPLVQSNAPAILSTPSMTSTQPSISVGSSPAALSTIDRSASKTQVLQQKASDTFNAFR